MPWRKVVFKACPDGQVTKARSVMDSRFSRRIWQPQHAQAHMFFDRFICVVHYLPYVIYVLFLPSALEQVYAEATYLL